MDLGKCPGCGAPWPKGQEQCPHCGSIGIGAGLQRQGRRFHIRRAKSIEEQSVALPWLGLILGILLTVALVKYEPWDKNWESVKVTLFHEEALVPISGRWEITRVVRIDPAGKALIPERADSGIVTFGAGGTFQMQLSGRGAASTAKGLYNQRGGNLFLSNVQSSNKSMGFPSQALARAVRTNEYGLVLTFGNKESVFLRSLASGGAPGKFVRVGSAQAPRSRRSRR